MSIKYNKLFALLEKKDLNKHYLRVNGINPKVVDSFVKNRSVTTEMIDRVCKLINCQPGDIMEYIPDEQDQQ